MSLRARLRLFIIALVVVVVVALSALYVRAVVETRFEDLWMRAHAHAAVVEGRLVEVVNQKAASYSPAQRNLAEMRQVWAEIVEGDPAIGSLLQTLTGSSRGIVEIVITGERDRILAASLPSHQGQRFDPLPAFDAFEEQNIWSRLDELLAPNQDYQVTRTLGLEGGQEVILTVRVILSTVLLRNAVMPQILDLAVVSAVSLLIAVLFAVAASRWAFRPLARISELIDRINRGETLAEFDPKRPGSSEASAVESKLSLLGEQVRGAREDATELRSNVDQLLDRMEEVVLLFGRDDRLAMGGSAAERLLGWGRWEAMGKPVDEIFPSSTSLGAVIQSAMHVRRDVSDHAVVLRRPDGSEVHLLVSVEMIEEFPNRQRAGTLVTLRDADPRLEIQSQLDVSSRLAAISRLTSGAAHEIKNPLNSIALHLEILRTKLGGLSQDADTEMEVIGREITRLDRVVKSFLDFTRPVDLNLTSVDLVALAAEIVTLVQPEARSQQVEIFLLDMPEEARVRGDRDLLMQAILNVVVNGVESMKEGGKLEIRLEKTPGEWVLTVKDQGGGIPDDLKEKIYNLYFTTKSKGSGIGLAMTFRVIQLHGGKISCDSQHEMGAIFRIELPSVADHASSTGKPGAQGLSSHAE